MQNSYIDEIRRQLENCEDHEHFGYGMCNKCCPMRENGVCTFDVDGALEALHAEPYDRQSMWEYINKCANRENRPSRKAVYGGSFNPFHNGHLDIVQQASELFDEVYVVIFRNTSKKDHNTDTEPIRQAIRDIGITNCHVGRSDLMLADFCSVNDITYSIRGLRNSMDYAYEESIACTNKMLNPQLETVYLRAKQDGVSSSCLREFMAFRRDVSAWVPPAVAKNLKERNLPVDGAITDAYKKLDETHGGGTIGFVREHKSEPSLRDVLSFCMGVEDVVPADDFSFCTGGISRREKLRVCISLCTSVGEADEILKKATGFGAVEERMKLLSELFDVDWNRVCGRTLWEQYTHVLKSAISSV